MALSLFTAALKTALELALPIVGVVAGVGVLIGVAQTVVQVQDQNVSFAPKLVAVALVVAAGGSTALGLLRQLFDTAIAALVHIAHA